MEYVTLKRTDKDFESYLMGFFSKEKRAIPVENLNISTTNEVVTFKLEKLENLKFPSLATRLLELFRLVNLTFVLVPYFIVLKILKFSWPQFYESQSWVKIASIGLALIFLMLAYNLRNDLQDHRIGLDRINPRSGSRALQKGWFTGKQVQNISWILIVLSALFALPYLLKALNNTRNMIGTITLVITVLIGFLNSTKSNMHSRFSLRLSVIGFLLSGPLLTFGAEWILGLSIHIETVVFGVIWGLWIVLLTQVKNFQSLISQVQAGVSSWMTRSGFDQIVKVLFITFVLMQLGFVYCFWYFKNLWIFIGHIVLSIVLSTELLMRVKNIRSSLGTDINNYCWVFQKAHYINSILLLLVFV